MTLSWVPRVTIEKNISATPTITASSAYVSGNQLGGIMTLVDVVRTDNNIKQGTALLTEVTILDADSQNAAIDIWFFSVSPTLVSSDHAAFNITDANLAAQCIGVVSVGSAYSASSSNSISSTTNLNKSVSVPSGTTIYAVAIVRGTPTYTTTTSLQFKFNFLVD